MSRLPDFLIIGAMKCATSTLHDQLGRQPGVWVSDPKEIYFFSDDDVYERGLDWYRAHFTQAPSDAICGESSTHYTKLPTYPLTVERMKTHLPSVKLIYVMRHPIDRLVSQYIHWWSERRVSVPLAEAINRHPELSQYSRYAWQLKPYFEAYGQGSVLPVFTERLRRFPQLELERVCRFLGLEGPVRWGDGSADHNVSSQRLRDSPLRDALVDAPGLSWVRRNLVPPSVRNRVKRFWTMNKRPELSDQDRSELSRVFDEDLAILGAWMGVDLNCANYKDIVTDPERVPGWSSSVATELGLTATA